MSIDRHEGGEENEYLGASIGFVHGTCDNNRCDACGTAPVRSIFRVVLDFKTGDLALDRAEQGENVLIRGLKWICSACAAAQSKCPKCGGPQVGMDEKFRWFCDDDGLVTCNPYVLQLREKSQSCMSPACENYSFEDCVRVAEGRRCAVGNGFPDPLAP